MVLLWERIGLIGSMLKNYVCVWQNTLILKYALMRVWGWRILHVQKVVWSVDRLNPFCYGSGTDSRVREKNV